MRNQRESISLQKLALILVDQKFENDHLIKGFNDLCSLSQGKEGGDDKPSEASFLEYLIFDLFTDHACFLLAFGREVASVLFETYSINILLRLTGTRYKVDWQEFMVLFDKRATEYHEYLQEYDPERLKNIDSNYLPRLGKAFSGYFVGCKDPAVIYQADGMFVLKLRYFYGEFLKKIVQEYEITLSE